MSRYTDKLSFNLLWLLPVFFEHNYSQNEAELSCNSIIFSLCRRINCQHEINSSWINVIAHNEGKQEFQRIIGWLDRTNTNTTWGISSKILSFPEEAI